MSIHYKFKSGREIHSLNIDRLNVPLAELKKLISTQSKLTDNDELDLEITDSNTGKVFSGDDTLIDRNASLIVSRVPIANAKRVPKNEGKVEENLPSNFVYEKAPKPKKFPENEEDRMREIMSQSTKDYDSTKYPRLKGVYGPLKPNYVCHRCGQKDHFIKDCPTNNPDFKRSTGIPRSHMVTVSADHKGAMMTADGGFAVPLVDHLGYQDVRKEKVPFVDEECKEIQKIEIPSELQCQHCKGLLVDAVLTPCCAESFCDECIRTILIESEEHQCPQCKQIGVSPDNIIPHRYNRLKVKAFNASNYESGTNENKKGNVSESHLPTANSPVVTKPVLLDEESRHSFKDEPMKDAPKSSLPSQNLDENTESSNHDSRSEYTNESTVEEKKEKAPDDNENESKSSNIPEKSPEKQSTISSKYSLQPIPSTFLSRPTLPTNGCLFPNPEGPNFLPGNDMSGYSQFLMMNGAFPGFNPRSALVNSQLAQQNFINGFNPMMPSQFNSTPFGASGFGFGSSLVGSDPIDEFTRTLTQKGRKRHSRSRSRSRSRDRDRVRSRRSPSREDDRYERERRRDRRERSRSPRRDASRYDSRSRDRRRSPSREKSSRSDKHRERERRSERSSSRSRHGVTESRSKDKENSRKRREKEKHEKRSKSGEKRSSDVENEDSNQETSKKRKERSSSVDPKPDCDDSVKNEKSQNVNELSLINEEPEECEENDSREFPKKEEEALQDLSKDELVTKNEDDEKDSHSDKEKESSPSRDKSHRSKYEKSKKSTRDDENRKRRRHSRSRSKSPLANKVVKEDKVFGSPKSLEEKEKDRNSKHHSDKDRHQSKSHSSSSSKSDRKSDRKDKEREKANQKKENRSKESSRRSRSRSRDRRDKDHKKKDKSSSSSKSETKHRDEAKESSRRSERK